MSSSKLYDHVSETANVIVSSMVSNITDAASSVSENVEDVVSSISSGVSDSLQNMSSGLQRMMTSPPDEEEIQKDIDSSSHSAVASLTPDDSLIIKGDVSSFKTFHPDSIPRGSDLMEQEIGMLDDHFSEPEIFELGNDATMEDIESAVIRTKDFILNCEESSQKRRIFVQRLIQLRLMLERAKEEKEVAKEGIQVHEGHQLTPNLSRLKHPAKQFCDRCSQVIWALIHVTYRCSLCGYQCHGKCVKSKHPKCPSQKFAESPSYILDICPEVGLAAQEFRCAQCRNLLNGKPVKSASCIGCSNNKGSAWNEPRLCDYTGRYYCPACHWNTRMIIPARVVHNWDFEEQPVSQQAKHFLSFVDSKPLIALEELNPSLYNFLGELYIVKKLRLELIIMKEYLRTCRLAQESRLLRRLQVRQHYVDDARFFSLQDLIDLNDGNLVPFIKVVHGDFVSHIKESCEGCRGKGFICELCDCEDVIFPFDDHISVCRMCRASFHEKCFASVSVCPRCIRQSSRRLKSQVTEDGEVINKEDNIII